MPDPLIQKVDCIHVEVPDLETGLAFYRDRLGHELMWRAEESAGLRMADGESEIVLNAGSWDKWKTDLLVESAEAAANQFVEAGGVVVQGPFDIAIGKAVVVRDPWENIFVLLDTSNGHLATDSDMNVVGIESRTSATKSSQIRET
ncbi:MAG: bleomycin resistance protein [Chloroflexi bacterium]|nr:bleomycin resistance protein [Chloroflexota bacterium]MBT4073700.1 bleomycin resistance protein [Chloroflexota bacterium]MBT4513961.1 bleomycin resistance protein [Chloroflexota bacterium]MBT6682494.1 bleomycin resistance protein [Chloroflexota bacterium]